MLTMHLVEFAGFSKSMFLEYLNLHDDTSYRIVLERELREFVYHTHVLFNEYHFAAYAGDGLNSISSRFSYMIPSLQSKHSFAFEIETKEIEKLASILFMIANVLYETMDEEHCTHSMKEAGEFFRFSFERKRLIPTWGLITIANMMLPKRR